MISLYIKKYCHDCPEFEPDVERNVYNSGLMGESTHYMTDIYCKHKDRCESMFEYLVETERGKNDD